MALPKDGTEKFRKSILSPFYHGVASGDPMTDRVIIWTRVTPTSHQEVEVKWEVASDNTFTKIVQKGSTVTDKSKDYTVKLDVTGLEANTSYFYRFSALNSTSTIGKTKTIDNTGQNEIKLGIVSCSNIQWGYFSAYKHLANKKLDAVLHLGDYFYEHGPNGYGDPEFVQKHVPPYEIVELSDYRTRYSQYRLDKDLQLIHQNHPFIAIWDDHEITNNSHKTGAENHQEDEGDYSTRKAVARKAYF
jgi:alkaline phosphatase D